MTTSDTIVAISSAVGMSARMILRLSGPDAFQLARQIGADDLIAGTARRVRLRLPNLILSAWIYAFRSPRSYSGEDMIELHIPGNPLLARMLHDDLLRRGARPAEPGEFTARAYFNGKLDLAEAEGVAAVIAAHGEAELRAARQLLSGELARRLRPAMDLLAETLALTEVGIDFSDEDVTFLSPDDLRQRIESIDSMLARLLNESTRFERLAHEPAAVLVGHPNAGKSTLLNALARQNRAIVSDEAGTTRDALVAEVTLRRGIIRLIDVAGLDARLPDAADQSPQAQIARQMHDRALRTAESADLVLLVHDVADTRPPPPLPREPDLRIHTKLDRLTPADRTKLAEGDIAVSALTGENLDRLRERLDALAFGAATPAATLALSARHVRAIDSAREAAARALPLAEHPELAAMELREALDHLGQILGQISPDDLLGQIFAKFCIGK